MFGKRIGTCYELRTKSHVDIVTELCDCDLSSVDLKETIPEPVAASYMYQILSAVAFMHSKGIVHGGLIHTVNDLYRLEGKKHLVGQKSWLGLCCQSVRFR